MKQMDTAIHNVYRPQKHLFHHEFEMKEKINENLIQCDACKTK